MRAVCAPEPAAIRAASAATTVFPEPTSPSSKRDIGTRFPRSPRISPNDFCCAPVSAKGSSPIHLASSASGTESGSADACAVQRARRCARASCNTRSSSNASLRRAANKRSTSSGKWTCRRADAMSGSRCRSRMAGGSGSGTSPTRPVRRVPPSIAVCSQRRIWPGLMPSVSG